MPLTSLLYAGVDLALLQWALGQLDKTYQMEELHVHLYGRHIL